MKRKITVEFVVDEEDVISGYSFLMPERAEGEPAITCQAALVSFIQHHLYDDCDGPQLEGLFTVTGNEITDQEIEP